MAEGGRTLICVFPVPGHSGQHERCPVAGAARARGSAEALSGRARPLSSVAAGRASCSVRGRAGRSAQPAVGAERDACRTQRRAPSPLGGWGVPVAESVLAPPGPIPNPVVTQRSAGEYCGGDPTGGEAAADTPHPRSQGCRSQASTPGARRLSPGAIASNAPRGGAAAARWAHNPKVEGSNPSPATRESPSGEHS